MTVQHLSLSHTFSLLTPAVGGHASLVRGSVPRQREERRHNVCAVGHRNPAGDRDQQPSAPAKAPPRHSGNHVAHQPLGPAHL